MQDSLPPIPQHRKPLCDTALACIAVAAFLSGHLSASAQPAASAALQPHRAVYEINLLRSSVGAGIADLTGRMAYELTGSDCAGYKQTMRMVTRTSNNEGGTSLSDLRSSFFEDADGRNFRFETQNYRDRRLSESSAGQAVVEEKPGSAAGLADADERLRVRLSAPSPKEFVLESDVLFPVEHSVKMLEAAKRGDRLFSADIYDGSDKGEKVFTVTAAIGAKQPADATTNMPAVEGDGEVLKDLPAWPVSLSYFETDNPRDDAAPTYELAFVFFENGVSRRLTIDYGTFAIRGVLQSLEIIEPEACAQ